MKTRAIFIPTIYYNYAKKQGNVSVFAFQAIENYVTELISHSIIEKKDYKVVGLYWKEEYEKLLNKYLPLSPCTSVSEFVRHAIYREIAKEIDVKEVIKRLEADLKDNEIIAEKEKYKIIGVA